MTDLEQKIDDIDRHLYRLMDQCPDGPEYMELYMALQRARGISYSMLPESKRKDFERKDST